jgi:hypothetical protein
LSMPSPALTMTATIQDPRLALRKSRSQGPSRSLQMTRSFTALWNFSTQLPQRKRQLKLAS